MLFGHLENLDGINFQLPEDHPVTEKVLKNLSAVENPIFYIGGPVWSSKDYVGQLYPPKTPANKYLEAYAKQLNSIEGNVTRRGLPDRVTVENWKSATPDDFKFSLKVPESISNRRLNNEIVYQELDKLVAVLDRLGNKAGTPFMLLPHYFSQKQLENLLYFLEKLPKGFDLALEQRNPEMFFNKEYHEALIKHSVSHIITDTPGRRDCLHQLITSDTVYIRFSGNNNHPSDAIRFEQWAKKLGQWTRNGVKKVYFFIHQPSNNRGALVDSIQTLARLLKAEIPEAQLKVPIHYGKTTQNTLF